MSKYAWVITHVNTKDLGEDMADEVGIAGPRDATPEMIERAKSEGVTFRMSDDDGIWYYRGKLWFDGITAPELSKHSEPERKYYICAGMGGDEEQEFGPLNDFGMPNAGAVNIHYRCDDTTTIDGGQPAKVWAVL
jgi:hypothetical protein